MSVSHMHSYSHTDCPRCVLQVCGLSSSCVSGERRDLHPPFRVQTLSGRQQYPGWSGKHNYSRGLGEITSFVPILSQHLAGEHVNTAPFPCSSPDHFDATPLLHGDVHRRRSSLQQQKADLRALPLSRRGKEHDAATDE